MSELPSVLPSHLAIIMDGNGRWAQSRGRNRLSGHSEGANTVTTVVEACRELGIGALTLYAFSEENWARPKTEIAGLMRLLKRFLRQERDNMLDKGIRLNAIGDIARLPKATYKALLDTMDYTKNGQHMVLTLALSYGGRQELVRAARALAHKAASGELNPANIDEHMLASQLDTNGLPDPDFLIRTSGELRISNFLLWQMAYSEFYFTNTKWPDFGKPELMEALHDYAARQRRYGKTGEQLLN